MKIINHMPVTIQKRVLPEMSAVQISRNDMVEHYITAYFLKDGNYESMLKQLTAYLKETGMQILSQFVFGGVGISGNFITDIKRGSGNQKWPVTGIHDNSPSGEVLSGTQLYGISGGSPTPVCLDGRVLGWCYEDTNTRYCLLGDIRPSNQGHSRVEQARDTFKNMERALVSADLDFSHVVRTWLYLDNMLAWYGAFNKVRDSFFREHKVFANVIPASTGIGVCNPFGPALVASAFAVKSKNAGVHIRPVVSPLQCSATDYQSSFSRAIEIKFPDHRRLYISGTASIDQNGKTLHIGDVNRQIERTMEVVKAILDSRVMGWKDTIRAIAYFKDIKDAAFFNNYCRKHSLLSLPVSVVQNDICRAELLFEIEVDLMALPKTGPGT